MSGAPGFNEVFFTGVRVRDRQRLGAVDDGWKVSLVTLMNERLAVGGATGAGWREFIGAARPVPGVGGGAALKEQALRGKRADWYRHAEGLEETPHRTMSGLCSGQPT